MSFENDSFRFQIYQTSEFKINQAKAGQYLQIFLVFFLLELLWRICDQKKKKTKLTTIQ